MAAWSHFQYFHFSLGVTHNTVILAFARRFYTYISREHFSFPSRRRDSMRYTKWQSRQQINCHSSAYMRERDWLSAPFIVFHAAHSVVCKQSSTFIHIKYFASHARSERASRETQMRLILYGKYFRAWCENGRDALAAGREDARDLLFGPIRACSL